jgi:hypothetical protein
MDDQQKKIIELVATLGLALGALEVIRTSPKAFNVEGIETVVKTIQGVLERTIGVK